MELYFCRLDGHFSCNPQDYLLLIDIESGLLHLQQNFGDQLIRHPSAYLSTPNAAPTPAITPLITSQQLNNDRLEREGSKTESSENSRPCSPQNTDFDLDNGSNNETLLLSRLQALSVKTNDDTEAPKGINII